MTNSYSQYIKSPSPTQYRMKAGLNHLPESSEISPIPLYIHCRVCSKQPVGRASIRLPMPKTNWSPARRIRDARSGHDAYGGNDSSLPADLNRHVPESNKMPFACFKSEIRWWIHPPCPLLHTFPHAIPCVRSASPSSRPRPRGTARTNTPAHLTDRGVGQPGSP